MRDLARLIGTLLAGAAALVGGGVILTRLPWQPRVQQALGWFIQGYLVLIAVLAVCAVFAILWYERASSVRQLRWRRRRRALLRREFADPQAGNGEPRQN